MSWTNTLIESERLMLRPFAASDAGEAFACITPGLTRYMDFEPAASEAAFAEVWREWLPLIASGADFTFVLRQRSDGHFLGLAGLHRCADPTPELGIWIREDHHGHGYGQEAVAAVAAWAADTFGAPAFLYPVAVDNRPSRRLVEALGGQLQGPLRRRKYAAVLYRLPAASLNPA